MAAAFPGGRTMVGSDEGLRGLTVVDLGLGMAAALIAKFLREAGAEITRIEPAAGDPSTRSTPRIRCGAEACAIEREASPRAAASTMSSRPADVCIIGGEDYPGVEPGEVCAAIQSRHPD